MLSQLPSAKADGLRVQGFKGSSDQGRIFSSLLSNPGTLEPLRRKRSNWSLRLKARVFLPFPEWDN